MAFIQYSCDSKDSAPEIDLGNDETDFEEAEEWELRMIAENCADHYYHHCEGWEANWPIVFEVFADGESIGKWRIGLEFEPSFSGGRKL